MAFYFLFLCLFIILFFRLTTGARLHLSSTLFSQALAIELSDSIVRMALNFFRQSSNFLEVEMSECRYIWLYRTVA